VFLPETDMRSLTWAPIVLALGACSEGGPVCNADLLLTSFVVEIRDSVSGQPRAAQAVATVTEGDSTEILRLVGGPDSLYRSGVEQREGIFDVQVEHSGYHPWVVNDLVVETAPGECRPEIVQLVARLQPI
jgi:hypothetical protein